MSRDWGAELRAMRDPEPLPEIPPWPFPRRDQAQRDRSALRVALYAVGWAFMAAMFLADVWLLGLVMGAWA